ncbi:MAG: hydrolase 2, exosortase A system-associated, partial [Gammaproteobacteria bacterium]
MTATSPLFIDGSRGALFCVHHRPDTPGGQGVIMLSAFAEEMNKSRHMVSEAARAMAAHGVEVLILDPWGTGESAGDHGEATWNQWCEDVERAAAYLRDGGVRSLGLWGLRVGALLAADCVERCAASWLVLWQPVTGGNLFLQQFLRLRLAAGMASGEGGESLKDLKAALAAGRTLEIAGYGLNPDMAAALEDARLRVPPGVAVHWFELPAQASDPLPPARQRPMDSLREAGVRLEVEQRVCDPFWSTAEIAHCPALIEANTAAVGRLFAGPTDPADARRRKAEEGREWPMNFAGASGELVGMLHRGGEDDAPLGVVVVVGGPQYRVGSHRQFVLLARDLAGAGIPVMRFDYNGMGDSEGGSAHFEACGGDIRAAVDALVEGCPSLGGVVLWGLCDGASAAM